MLPKKAVGKLAAEELNFLVREKSRYQHITIDLSLNLAMLRFSKVEEHLMGENNSSPGTFWAPLLIDLYCPYFGPIVESP